MPRKITRAKAKQILRDKSVRGKRLTAKQKRFFGAIAGGETAKSNKRSTKNRSKRRRVALKTKRKRRRTK